MSAAARSIAHRRDERRAGAMAAFTAGWGRVRGAPWLIAGTWLATLLLAAPLAWVLRGLLAAHLDASLAAQTAAHGVNFDWWNEFLAQASGLGQSFVPRIIGFAAVLGNLSRLADGIAPLAMPLAAAGAFVLLSIFLAGGVLDRLARDRATGAGGFFAACGVYFFRFLRLGVIAAIAYGWLFGVLHPWLFDDVLGLLGENLTVERTAAAYRAAAYVVFGASVAAVNLLFDYAKVRAVVEDRRSMVTTLFAALRFVRRNAGAALTLYALNLAAFLLLVLLYSFAAPGVGGGWRVWLGLLIGQLYILLRAALRLQFAASQVALFQSRLAHARYTAAPAPVWPDSPDAEAIRV